MTTNEITFANYTPPSIQFFDGDHIIKIKFDGTLELGSAWADHNDVATAIFNNLVDYVMPAWKQAARMEERVAIVAWLRERQAAMPCQSDSAVEQMGITADDIEAGEHLK